MIKKLDKLVLKAFAGPFLLTLAVVQFILLTQTLLKYLDDLIGKDLGLVVIAKLMFFLSVLMVPTSLPLAVLLSSLMTYGSMGELTAIKASGIALTRILRPVLLVSLGLLLASFWFNKTIVPKANLKAYSLLWDVRQQKLALDIREGVFYGGIPGYTIKVDHKTGPEKDRLHGVIIYNHTQQNGSYTVMLADSGRMFTRFNGAYLGLELFHGHNYVEQPDARNRAGASFIRQGFDHNVVTFSLASFDLNRTKEELFQTNRMMLTIPQLRAGTDSIQRRLGLERHLLPRQLDAYYTYLRFDTLGAGANRRVARWQVPPRRLPKLTAAMAEQATNRARNLRESFKPTTDKLVGWPATRPSTASRSIISTPSRWPCCSCFSSGPRWVPSSRRAGWGCPSSFPSCSSSCTTCSPFWAPSTPKNLCCPWAWACGWPTSCCCQWACFCCSRPTTTRACWRSISGGGCPAAWACPACGG